MMNASPPADDKLQSFAEMGLDTRLLRALDSLGYSRPTPVQAATIPKALAGQDLLVSAETGTGKTAAYLLPILHRLVQQAAPASGTAALVLTPTRELCRQVLKHCKQLAALTHLRINIISGGQDFKYQRALFRKIPDVIIATPGRLLEHIEKGSTDFNDLQALVIDEADRMLDMGMSEDVIKIASTCSSQRQTLLCSATLDSNTLLRGDAYIGLLREPVSINLAQSLQAGSAIRQQVILSDDENHKNRVLLKLLQQGSGKVIVFTNTRAQCSKLAGWLRYKDIDTGLLHGEMQQDARNDQMNRLRRGRVGVLVATDVAARGLDIPRLELVVNYDLPHSSEDFVHRCGRTGRAGESGRAVSLITARDWDRMVRFENALGQDFERLKLPGLEASFKGPQKLKSSGKQASSGKRKTAVKPEKKDAPKTKQRHRDRKNIGKRRKPSAAGESAAARWGNGFAPAPVKKPKG